MDGYLAKYQDPKQADAMTKINEPASLTWCKIWRDNDDNSYIMINRLNGKRGNPTL
jgi:hypothetical protein